MEVEDAAPARRRFCTGLHARRRASWLRCARSSCATRRSRRWRRTRSTSSWRAAHCGTSPPAKCWCRSRTAGPVRADLLHPARRGHRQRGRGRSAPSTPSSYEAGDLFPLAAALGGRAVTATYTLSGRHLRAGAAASPRCRNWRIAARVFAEFLQQPHRALSRAVAARAAGAYASEALAEQSLETPLGELVCATAGHLPAAIPAAGRARRRCTGGASARSLACGRRGRVEGILTRHDVLGRVALAGRSAGRSRLPR